MRFQVENMTCDGCARSVARLVRKLDPAAEVTVDLERKSVDVQSAATPSDVAAALSRAGYPAATA